MADKVRLRATLVVEYDADPKYYGTDNPEHMAKIDEESWKQVPDALLSLFDEGDNGTAKVEPA